jgi:ribosomal-protein-alanine N-acetyltransferase
MDPIFRPGAIDEPNELRDAAVVLRRWSYDDLACIDEASRDPVIPSGTTVPSPFSDAEGRAFVERQWGRATSGEGLSLAIVDARSGSAAGLVCLLHRQQPGVVGLGYWIVTSRRRRRLAAGSVILLSRWALGLRSVDRIEAHVDPANRPSIRVLDGAGFQREAELRGYFGRDGARSDALLFSLIATDIG